MALGCQIDLHENAPVHRLWLGHPLRFSPIEKGHRQMPVSMFARPGGQVADAPAQGFLAGSGAVLVLLLRPG